MSVSHNTRQRINGIKEFVGIPMQNAGKGGEFFSGLKNLPETHR